MNNVSLNQFCCGCGSCALACPAQCIQIQKNEDGFWTAKVNESLCVDCGLCRKICPVVNTELPKEAQNNQTYYAAVSKNKEFYQKSSSGGVFSAVAEKILSVKGSVFGCGYDRNLNPCHREVTELQDLESIRRSKYVQSSMGTTYNIVKARLEEGRQVLFCGTPCQVAGLKNFLRKKYDNLFTIDLICHGVPSVDLFQKNLQFVESKRRKKIQRFDFRLKTENSLDCFQYVYTFEDGKQETGPYYNDAFYDLFYDMKSLNDICYSCPYSTLARCGDFTIGDYAWGKPYHPEFSQCREVSCILCNTEKGSRMLKSLTSELLISPTDLNWILERNHNLKRPTLRPAGSEKLYFNIRKIGYDRWANRHLHSLGHLKKTKGWQALSKIKRKILH